jgi:Flp pilus assembly pilin Flp
MNQLLMRAFWHLRYREDGQTLVEYALILGLVSIAAVTILNVIGGFAPGAFSQINADF